MREFLIAALLVASPAFATAPPSGFIEDPPALTTDAQRPGARSYIAAGRDLRGFSRVAIDPVLVWYSPESKYQGIEPNELAAVANGLREILVEQLEPRYAVVKTEGPGVLQVRLAITNVVAQKKKKGLLGYTPVGLVAGAVKGLASSAPNIDLGAAVIEAELLDGDGKRLAVFVEPLADGKGKAEALTWESIGTVMAAYAQRLRKRLDADNPD
jgi:hypothetical protein